LLELKKKGKAESTIASVRKALKFLAKHADLDKPETVKGFLAQLDRKNGYKRNLTFAYNVFVKICKLQWEKPNYFAPQKLPKIPTKEKVEMLIANSSTKLALAISISRGTGMRPIEVMHLRLKDIDLGKGYTYPETAKHGSPRRLKLKQSTLDLLKVYLSNHDLTLNAQIFGIWTSTKYGDYFRDSRNRLAKKLNDASLKTIRLYDLRHRYATMLYATTRDILLVKQQMGHRKLETTLMYTQLIDVDETDAFTCRTATNAKEIADLIENGFQYVTEQDGLKFFKKRK